VAGSSSAYDSWPCGGRRGRKRLGRVDHGRDSDRRDSSREGHPRPLRAGAAAGRRRGTTIPDQPVPVGPGAGWLWLLVLLVANTGTSAVIASRRGCCRGGATWRLHSAVIRLGGQRGRPELHGGDPRLSTSGSALACGARWARSVLGLLLAAAGDRGGCPGRRLGGGIAGGHRRRAIRLVCITTCGHGGASLAPDCFTGGPGSALDVGSILTTAPT